MRKPILVVMAFVLSANISGCAAVCNPQSPGAAIGTGTQIGMVVGLAQFGACGAYYLANKAIDNVQTPQSNASVTDPTRLAVTPPPPPPEEIAKPPVDNLVK